MLVALVWETRGEWRHKISDASGLPFSRARILWRLLDASMTLKQIVDDTGSDAPAVTVAVNDLEDRGLVERNPHPDNRRAKLVSITSSGQQLIEAALRVARDDAPPAMQRLSKTDLAHLSRILERIHSREP
ncbi:MarR family transcriptional regulator [Dyella caseinilytica]|uniref:MarR family transcriptional regulator n=2 Tax=Dyella caseinilytica TaxID=1849581 RepID=A0ABX7H021_9GAMM|nr:MarR family transcriptional regulator [Dyella caseinilytica]